PNRALAPAEERPVAAEQKTPWYRDSEKTLTIVLNLLTTVFITFAAVSAWYSYKIAKAALSLQSNTVAIIGQQAALQEWSMYQTYWNYCNATGKPVMSLECQIYREVGLLSPPPVNQTRYFGLGNPSRRRPDGEIAKADETSYSLVQLQP
ncbi:MAG: hypothetical protein Q9214_008095, partial [Letrouitia sp. 1 TL-2023]